MSTLIAIVAMIALGAQLASQGWTAILWLPLGLALGLFGVANVVLLPLMGIPTARELKRFGMAKPGLQSSVLLAAATVSLVYAALAGAFFLVAPNLFQEGLRNPSFVTGFWIGAIGVLLTPFSAKGKKDFQDDFFARFAKHICEPPQAPAPSFSLQLDTFFDQSRIDGVELETRADFHADAVAYGAALASMNSFTKRAYSFDDTGDPYTESELTAHGKMLDVLGEAFGNLRISVDALSADDKVYPLAVAIYETACATYEEATDGYGRAGACAMESALRAQLDAKKLEFDALVRRSESNRGVAAAADAEALENKAANDLARAASLERLAAFVESDAKGWCDEARSNRAYAETLVKASPK